MTIIDVGQLLEQLEGDDDLLQVTNEMLQEEAALLQARLRQALANGDLATLNSEAHSVKGMLSNFFAAAACETAHKIECFEDGENLADAKSLLDQLEQQIATMQSELQQLIASRAS